MLVAGVIGFAVVVRALGWDGIWNAIRGMGAWGGVIAAIDLCGLACDAVAIRGFLGAEVTIPFRRVLAAQASGIAINRLTPGNSLGEPVKIRMLMLYVPTDPAVSAVVMFNVATILLGIVAIVVGVPLTAGLLELPPRVAVGLWIGVGVLIAFAIVLVVLVRRGASGSLVGALQQLRVIGAARGDRWRARLHDIDARLAVFPRRPVIGVIGSRLFNWLGTIVVLHAAGIALEPALVAASLTVGILITWMTNVIPLGMGLADGSNYVLYGVLGATPAAGLLFTMVNRLRTIVLAVMGLAIMAIARGTAPPAADYTPPPTDRSAAS